MAKDSISLFDDGRMRTLSEIEREIIILAHQFYGGNMALIARSIGMGRSTLYRKIQEMPEDARARLATAEAVEAAPS